MAPTEPLSFEDIKTQLESAGYMEMGQKGCHVKFGRYSVDNVALMILVETVIVPHQDQVPAGALRSIWNQASMGKPPLGIIRTPPRTRE